MVASSSMKMVVPERGKLGPFGAKPERYPHIAWTFRLSGTFAFTKDKWREKPEKPGD